MNTTPFSTVCCLLLVLACLVFPLTAAAQEVPVVTEDQVLTQDEVGKTIEVPIRVSGLREASTIESYQFDIQFPTSSFTFEEFDLAGSLTEEANLSTRQTDPSDANDSGAARLVAAALSSSSTPLDEAGDSGVLATLVLTVDTDRGGAVTFPADAFTFEGGDVPADLSQADFEISVGAIMTIGEAREQDPGTSAILEGTVTRAFGVYVRFQDESGPTGASGLAVRQASGPLSEDFQGDIADGTIAQGTELTVRGTLSERDGLLVIDGEDLASYSVGGQGLLPLPQPVSLFELEGSGGEDYESELLRIEGLSFENPSTTGGTLDANTTYAIVDEDATAFDYRVGSAEETDVIGAPIPEGTFTYEGVLGRSAGGFALVPVRRSTGLPVELARFEATLSGGTATLTWQTASETDNAGFYVQHRPPAAKTWTDLGFVESSAEGGTTDTPQSYRFATEALPPGEHRFRLRQVDLDGTATLSDAVRVEVRADRTLSLRRAGPHPARTSTQLGITTEKSGTATVALYNALGQRVRQVWTGDMQAGTRHVVTVQVQTLPSGTYFARLTGPGGTTTRKLTVVR